MSTDAIVAIDPTTKRIIPTLIPLVFRELGVIPVRGWWVSVIIADGSSNTYLDLYGHGTCVACLVGVLAVAHNGLWDATEYAVVKTVVSEDDLPRDYVFGLSDGWEGSREHNYVKNDQDIPKTCHYTHGVEDGRAAYKACVEEGMVIQLAP